MLSAIVLLSRSCLNWELRDRAGLDPVAEGDSAIEVVWTSGFNSWSSARLTTPTYTRRPKRERYSCSRIFICSLVPVHEDLPLVGLFFFLPGDRLLRRHCAPGSLSLRVPYPPSSADLRLSRTCLWLASLTFQRRRPASGWLLKPPSPSPRPLSRASS